MAPRFIATGEDMVEVARVGAAKSEMASATGSSRRRAAIALDTGSIVWDPYEFDPVSFKRPHPIFLFFSS